MKNISESRGFSPFADSNGCDTISASFSTYGTIYWAVFLANSKIRVEERRNVSTRRTQKKILKLIGKHRRSISKSILLRIPAPVLKVFST